VNTSSTRALPDFRRGFNTAHFQMLVMHPSHPCTIWTCRRCVFLLSASQFATPGLGPGMPDTAGPVPKGMHRMSTCQGLEGSGYEAITHYLNAGPRCHILYSSTHPFLHRILFLFTFNPSRGDSNRFLGCYCKPPHSRLLLGYFNNTWLSNQKVRGLLLTSIARL